jgi:hypothetical protein
VPITISLQTKQIAHCRHVGSNFFCNFCIKAAVKDKEIFSW